MIASYTGGQDYSKGFYQILRLIITIVITAIFAGLIIVPLAFGSGFFGAGGNYRVIHLDAREPIEIQYGTNELINQQGGIPRGDFRVSSKEYNSSRIVLDVRDSVGRKFSSSLQRTEVYSLLMEYSQEAAHDPHIYMNCIDVHVDGNKENLRGLYPNILDVKQSHCY